MDRKLETKAVKQALIKAGFTGVKVSHGQGTAWGWLHIDVDQNGDYQRTDREATRIAQQVTGRHGDYDGNILVQVKRDYDALDRLMEMEAFTR